MEFVVELLKITLPAGLVLYAMYLTVRSFVNKELQQKYAELKNKQLLLEESNKDKTLPMRLQAYERLTLFLERISPAQIVPRLSNPELNVAIFRQILTNEIRNEFAHNLAQQMYLSDDLWISIKKAKEEMIVLINQSSETLEEEANSLELSKKILENAQQFDINPAEEAIRNLKAEVSQLWE